MGGGVDEGEKESWKISGAGVMLRMALLGLGSILAMSSGAISSDKSCPS